MTKNIDENVIQAYEEIVEQSCLEAYFRSHLAPSIEGNLEEESLDDIDEEDGWTEEELELFFCSLERRGKVRCDLIAKDLRGCKSVSQIAHLIHLFEQENQSISQKSTQRNLKRDIENIPAAFEVSQEWQKVENSISSRLQQWEEVQHSFQLSKVDKSEGARPVIDWDKQVLSTILFLRYCKQLDPKKNRTNTRLKVPNNTDGKLKTFSFSIQEIVNILLNKDDESEIDLYSFREYSSDHSVPVLHHPQESEMVAWRLIYRSIELGFFIPIWITKEKSSGKKRSAKMLNGFHFPSSQETDSTFEKRQDQLLIWNDDSEKVDQLQKMRLNAIEELLRTLSIKELRLVMNLIHEECDAKYDEELPEEEAEEQIGEEDWNGIMYRFLRIGLTKENLLENLKSKISVDDLNLFHVGEAKVRRREKKDGGEKMSDQISTRTMESLATCLKFIIYRTLEFIEGQTSHSLRTDDNREKGYITQDHIRHAFSQITSCFELNEEEKIQAHKDKDYLSFHSFYGIADKDIETASNFLKGVKSFQIDKQNGTILPLNHMIMPPLHASFPFPSEGELDQDDFLEIVREEQASAKEEKEMERWNLIDKQDLQRAKEEEEFLWSRLGLKIPKSLHYDVEEEEMELIEMMEEDQDNHEYDEEEGLDDAETETEGENVEAMSEDEATDDSMSMSES